MKNRMIYLLQYLQKRKTEQQKFETNRSTYGNVSPFAECSSTLLSLLCHIDKKFEDHLSAALMET